MSTEHPFALSWAYSPCPNDTYIFYALAHNKFARQPAMRTPHLCDIAELNDLARRGTYDVIKISAAIYPEVAGEYQILASGGAFGVGVGPILVARELSDLPAKKEQWRVAVPGLSTTANLLLSHFHPEMVQRTPCLFSEIGEAVARGEYEAGVLIHEGRFTYQEHGLVLLEDFGAMWQEERGLPLPLGLICVRRSLPLTLRLAICEAIRQSIDYAGTHTEETFGYMRQHAQEMADAVMAEHVRLYVNAFSYDLGERGREALTALLPSTKLDILQ